MNTIQPSKNKDGGRPLSQADLALAAVARFYYLTAAQLGRLLYPNCHDDNRYARRRLARLAEAGLLLCLPGMPTPRYGSAPHVFTLGRGGRALLDPEDRYYRPSEEQAKARNYLFMDHTLATVDVLIAAARLCQSAPVSMPRLLTERQLRVHPTRVQLPGADTKPARWVSVIPDAWFELSVGGAKPIAIALELDRGTEDQKRWRAKVAALASWATGPYRQVFDNPTLTIAVVTPDEARRENLRTWTSQELAHLGHQALSEIFLFTSADPVTTPPTQLYFGPCWYEPDSTVPVSLLPPVSPLVSAKEVWPAEGG